LYFNTFAPGSEALDLSQSEEVASLLVSAGELGVSFKPPVLCRARNIVVNGLRLHLLEWGDEATPLVLLFHGANQTGHSWDMVSLNLSQDYHVIAVDQRGHGDSEWPRDGDMSPQALMSDAEALIQTLSGGEPPMIVAHSMGGLVLLWLLTRKRLARKAVIVDVGPEVAREGAGRIQQFVRNAREWDSVDDYVAAVAAYDPFRRREHIERTLKYNVMQRADGKLVSKHFPRLFNPEGPRFERPSYESIAAIECPLLIVRGEESDVLSADAAERFSAALPNGSLVTVPASGHNVHSQNSAGFLAAVRPFLAAD